MILVDIYHANNLSTAESRPYRETSSGANPGPSQRIRFKDFAIDRKGINPEEYD